MLLNQFSRTSFFRKRNMTGIFGNFRVASVWNRRLEDMYNDITWSRSSAQGTFDLIDDETKYHLTRSTDRLCHQENHWSIKQKAVRDRILDVSEKQVARIRQLFLSSMLLIRILVSTVTAVGTWCSDCGECSDVLRAKAGTPHLSTRKW